MPDMHTMFKRHRQLLINLLAIYVLGWGFTSYKAVFLGLPFGTSLGLYNYWLLVRKTEQFGQKIIAGKPAKSLGMFNRLASAALLAVVALRFPEHIHLISAVLGLVTIYIVIMIDYFIKMILK